MLKSTKSPQISSSSSSVKSNPTPNQRPMEDEEDGVVHYLPGCRRDANCDCSICLESIKSTLDLMPMSAQRTSLSKLSASKPLIVYEKTPISIDPTLLSTPTSRSRPDPSPIRLLTPIAFRSTAKSAHPKQEKRTLRGSGSLILVRIFMCLSLFLVGEFGVPWLGFRVVGPPRLSSIVVERLVKSSLAVDDLGDKFRVLELGMEGYGFDWEISRCWARNSTWKINHDGLLLNSRCTIYKSAAEEVFVWGWPLQTAGLLTAGVSSRSMTVISGRIIEWGNGGIGYLTAQNASSTRMLAKWSSAAVQLDPNTWVLEYKRSALFDNPRFFSTMGDFLKFMASAFIRRVRRELWFFPCMNDCSHCVGASMTAPKAAFGKVPT